LIEFLYSSALQVTIHGGEGRLTNDHLKRKRKSKIAWREEDLGLKRKTV
jgi:hypothetical protein